VAKARKNGKIDHKGLLLFSLNLNLNLNLGFSCNLGLNLRVITMSLIDIRNLSKTYDSGDERVSALLDLDLTIEGGEFISIMGPSGSGKSTLLTILGGLNHPTNGEVVVDEIPIYRLPLERLADFRREYVGFIFQSFQLILHLMVIVS
jgi:putative ABC transport system ATP-binding protein